MLRAREAAIAVRMVRDGWTIREVADRLGVSPATAWRRYRWGEELAVLPDDAPLPTTRGVVATWDELCRPAFTGLGDPTEPGPGSPPSRAGAAWPRPPSGQVG